MLKLKFQYFGHLMQSWLIRKDPDAGKDWRQEEKGTAEDKMVGWHHQINEHEFEQALGDGERQWDLLCCSPWSHKESDVTERLNSSNYVPGPLMLTWKAYPCPHIRLAMPDPSLNIHYPSAPLSYNLSFLFVLRFTNYLISLNRFWSPWVCLLWISS